MTLSTDFKKAVGSIKPVNGVNCAPIISYYNYSLFEKLQSLKCPFADCMISEEASAERILSMSKIYLPI